MERGKVRGDYASAYKLSGSGSTVDKKVLRVHRRSLEQKELRQVAQNKRRPLADLSPVQEGNNQTVDKSYQDKTPVKGRDCTSKSQKRNDRLDQLMKWKKERELKKKLEAQSASNPVFRVSKAVVREDQTLFKKPTVKHTVAQVKQPVKPKPHHPVPAKVVTVTHHAKAQPASSRARPTQSTTTRSNKTGESTSQSRRPTTRTRQTSGPCSEPMAKKIKENVPSRSTRQRAAVPSVDKGQNSKQVSKSTRQSARNKVPAVSTKTIKSASSASKKNAPEVKNVVSDESKVTTGRGESFAPAEFSFNVSSFVFKPLSPGSAAGFLFPGQDNSCTSFLETNPKRASTPKKDKDVRRSSRDVAKVTDKFCDTMLLENTVVNMKDNTVYEKTTFASTDEASTSKRNTRQSRSSTSATNNATDKNKTMNTPSDKTVDQMENTLTEVTSSIRRSTRQATRRVTRSSNRSANDSGCMMEESQALENVSLDLKSTKKSDDSQTRRTRSRSRKSAVFTEKTEEPERELVQQISNAESYLKDNSVKQSQNKLATEEPAKSQDQHDSTESSSDEVFVEEPKSSVRRSMRRSVLSTNTNEEMDLSINLRKVNTPKSALKKDNKSTKKVKHVTLSADLSEEDEEQVTRKSARHARRSMPCARDVKKASKKLSRKSMLPRLPKSPEEWVDLLSNSPMIEMSRRTPKAANTSIPALNFDDVDLEQPNFNDTDSDVPVPMETNTTNNAATPSTEPKAQSPASPTPVSSVTSPGDTEKVISCAISVPEEVPAVSTSEDTDITEQPDIDRPIAKATSPKAPETVQFCEVSSTQGPAEDTLEEHDIKYFRNMVISETSRLNNLSKHWDDVNLDKSLSEDVHGQIRTTVGQAQLLIAQRFKQFIGLVDNCEFKQGEKETTCTDLQGFWDMIFFQVEDVDAKFKGLEKLQANNWVEDAPVKVKKQKKKVDKPSVAKPVVKSKFAAFRAQMKKKQTAPPDSPVLQTSQEEKVFEIPGFFRVASPVRTPKPHCEAGTPKKATPVLPSKTSQEESQKSNSAPGSAENIIHRLSTRKSYAPIVPSPLLQDTTPLPRPTRTCTQKTPMSSPKVESVIEQGISRCSETGESASKRLKTTPARRSIRSRKSVNFTEDVSDIKAVEKPQTPKIPSDSVSDDEMNISHDEMNVSQDSFSKYLQPLTKSSNSRSRRASLKGCRSTERRRSRRSVHFSSPAREDVTHMKMPRTPFNKDSITKQTRVTRRSVGDGDIFSMDNVDNDENTPPAPATFRSPRPSLLYTPPDRAGSPVINSNVPTGILISFTP